MKNARKAVVAVLAIFLLAGCKAWDCGCPMSEVPVNQEVKRPVSQQVAMEEGIAKLSPACLR